MGKKRKGSLDFTTSTGLRLGERVTLQGVRSELLLALMIVSDLCSVHNMILRVSAICNGRHMRNSLHYTGAAVDLVVDIGSVREAFMTELRYRLGPAYDAIDEGTHIHIEYQPHSAAGA